MISFMPFACREDVVDQAATHTHGDEVEFIGEDVGIDVRLLGGLVELASCNRCGKGAQEIYNNGHVETIC